MAENGKGSAEATLHIFPNFSSVTSLMSRAIKPHPEIAR
jgi:hypothetical protein